MSDWLLAIDYGTTYTVAATAEPGQRPEPLLISHRPLPSAVYLADDGRIVVGQAALNQAAIDPTRFERKPKQHLAQRALFLGGKPVEPAEAAAAALRRFLDEGRRRFNNTAPSAVRLTHPAKAGSRFTDALRRAADKAGMPEVELVEEPVAAARQLISDPRSQLGPRATIAVYDLGGGTFDVAVVRRDGDDVSTHGQPGGAGDIGGEAFDEALYRHVGEQIARRDPESWLRLDGGEDSDARSTRLKLREDLRLAKETISDGEPSYRIRVGPPVDDEVRLTAAELDQVVRLDVLRTLEVFEETVRAAGLKPEQLDAIYLTGGSSRLALVDGLMRGKYGERVETRGDPKGVVALGAAPYVKAPEPPPPPPPPTPPKPPPTPPKPPEPAGRPWRKVAVVAAVALALGGGVAAIAASGGGGDGDGGGGGGDGFGDGDVVTTTGEPASTATPGGGSEDSEDELFSYIPSSIDSSCDVIPTSEHDDWGLKDAETPLAGYDCAAPGRARGLVYWLYGSKEDMNAELSDTSELGDGFCGEEWGVAGEWVNDGVEGQVICYSDDGKEWIEWTEENLYVYAWITGPTRTSVRNAWNDAGPIP